MRSGLDGVMYHIATNEVIFIRDMLARICSKLCVNFDEHLEALEELVSEDFAYHLDRIKVGTQLRWQDHIVLDQRD